MNSNQIAKELIDAQGSYVVLTIGGEEYEGYVDYLDYAPYQDGPDYLTPDPGEIYGTFALASEEVAERDLPTTQVTIMARETSPGEWTEPSAAVWDPKLEDGTVVKADWRSLGSVENIETNEQ